MKKMTFTLILLMSMTMMSIAQWASPGTQEHTANDPEISKSRPMLTLNNTNTQEISGLRMRLNNLNQGFIFYDNDTEEFSLGATIHPDQNSFSVHRTTGNARLLGRLAMVGTGNEKLVTEGDQMLWYNKTTGEASWAFDANYNRFARPLTIGSGLVPTNSQNLVISDGQNIAMVGDYGRIQWYAGANSDHTGPNACWVGTDNSGTFYIESNLGPVLIDGENGIVFKGSDDTRAAMSSSGNWVFGGGVPNIAYRLCINGDVKINGELFTTSDARMKRNINRLSDGLSKVMKLSPVSYEYKHDQYECLAAQESEQIGFLAQEVEKIFPDLVSTSKEIDVDGNAIDAKSINYVQLIPILTKAIQEQQTLIDRQADAIKELQEKIK